MAVKVFRVFRPATASLRYLRQTATRTLSSTDRSTDESDDTAVKETIPLNGRYLRFILYKCLFYCAFSRLMDDPYFGISTSSFPQKILSVLLRPVNEPDVEIKPDGENNLYTYYY